MSVYLPRYKDPKSGELEKSRVWWMEFSYKGARVRESTAMTSKTRAKEAEQKRKRDLQDGTAGIRRNKVLYFREAAAEWVTAKTPKWSASSLSIARNSLQHLGPVFNNKLLSAIEAKHVADYQKAREAAGASGRSINIEVSLVRQVMKRAGQWERVRSRVEMRSEKTDVGHSLTAQEETALLAECAASRSRALLPFVTLALETGARYSTIRNLQWANVDFVGRRLMIGKDKTAAGTGRTIPLLPRALQTLVFWSEQFPDRKPTDYVFPSERYSASGTDETFGFVERLAYDTDATKPAGRIKTAWEQARARTRHHCPHCEAGRLVAEVKPATGYVCSACGWCTAALPPGLGSIRLHDLRHSAVSRMVVAGIPLPIIGRIVGWSGGTLALMSARYGHFTTAELRSAMERMTRPEPVAAETPRDSPKNPPKSALLAPGNIQ